MWTTVLPIVTSEDVRSFTARQQLVNCLSPTTHARRDGGKWTTPAWGLPTGLARYASRYGSQLGLPLGVDWMRRHTLAPYYLSTLPCERHAAFEARLLDYRPGPRRPLLPIAAAEWFTPLAVLCPACDDEHLAAFGFSVVLRQWLLPFATRCAVHGELLRQYPAWTPLGRAAAVPIQVRPLRRNQGIAMAEAGGNALHTGQSLLELLGGLLQSRGLVTAVGRIRRKPLCAAFHAYAANRFEHSNLDALLSMQTSVARVLAPIWTPRSCLHPAVAYALVEALQDSKEVEQEQLWPSPAGKVDRMNGLAAALASCETLTEAAQKAGVTVTTAAVRARAMGVPFSERPKKLDAQLRLRVEDLLLHGKSVGDVAKRTGLSDVTVYRVVKSNPQLAAVLACLKKEEQLRTRRGDWLQAAQANPSASRKQLRENATAAYAYLYRWDRAWLAINPSGRQPHKPAATVRTTRAPVGAQEELLARLRQLQAADSMELSPRLTLTRQLKAAGRSNSSPAKQTLQLKEALEATSETVRDFVRRRLSAAAARVHNAHQPLTISAIERGSRLRPDTIRRSGVRTEVVVASTRSFNLKRRV